MNIGCSCSESRRCALPSRRASPECKHQRAGHPRRQKHNQLVQQEKGPAPATDDQVLVLAERGRASAAHGVLDPDLLSLAVLRVLHARVAPLADGLLRLWSLL